MANYFYNHKNTIFTFNKGKNKGGKVPGRLEYKNGRLFFVSLGRKNKLEKKLLTRNHFVAQKDFKNALVEPSNKEIQMKLELIHISKALCQQDCGSSGRQAD